MLVLALDSSSAAVSADVVAVTAGRLDVRARQQTIDPRGHTEHLAPTIAAALATARATARDLDAIVAGTGPGPFTGLRVGLVTAAAMGEALGVPTYGVCSLDGLAGAHPEQDGPLLVATDARRREVYWAIYRAGERVDGPNVSRPEDVPPGDGAMTGAGAALYRDLLGRPLLDTDYPLPRALVRVALARIESAAPSETLVPLYLRRPDAVPPKSMGRPKTVGQPKTMGQPNAVKR